MKSKRIFRLVYGDDERGKYGAIIEKRPGLADLEVYRFHSDSEQKLADLAGAFVMGYMTSTDNMRPVLVVYADGHEEASAGEVYKSLRNKTGSL